MTGTRSIYNLALIGFMGTGKSCVGRMVASALHFDYLDTDQVIEFRAHKSISQIFEQDGEPVFVQWPTRHRIFSLVTWGLTRIRASSGGFHALRIQFANTVAREH